MEISIEWSPQHWFPSEGSNSELFAHENDANRSATAPHLIDNVGSHCVWVLHPDLLHYLNTSTNINRIRAAGLGSDPLRDLP